MKGLFILLMLASCKMFAQSDSSIIIRKDPRVDLLIKKQIQINEETTRDSRRNIPGFRIQVINSTDRNKVFSAKARIYQQYPELKPYIVYQPPNYKLKVGNFKTTEEAEAYIDELSKLVETTAYVVHDTIEVKPD